MSGNMRLRHGTAWFGLAVLLVACHALNVRAEGLAVPVASTSLVVVATNTAVVAAAAPAFGITLRDAWQFGGWIMWALAAMSVFGLALVTRQLACLREAQVVPQGLLAEVLDRIRAGELGEARRLCEDRPCALSAIALKTFDHLRHSPKAGVALLRDAVEAEGSRQADRMLSQAQMLLDLAVIAPMCGLLGTVLGLLQIFGPAGSDAGSARASLLAGGVNQALVTTAFGLLVAIPAMVCHAWMRRRVMRLIAALESAAADIVTAVVGRYNR